MPLLAYDRRHAVLAVLHDLHWTAPDGTVHTVDMEAAERSGPLTDLWYVSGARGSCFWPEHLGDRFLEFRAEGVSGRVVRLVHRRSGHVRLRGAVEDALAAIEETQHRPLLIARRRIIGDPGAPLRLDDDGRTWTGAEGDAERWPPIMAQGSEPVAEVEGRDAAPAVLVDDHIVERDQQPAQEDEHDHEPDHAEDERVALPG